MQLNRPYAVVADRVEYEVIRRTLKRRSIKIQIKEHILLPFVKPYIHFMIRQSQVGLFQGQDCYQVFAPSCRQPFCVYNVHTQKSDQIHSDSLLDKGRSLQAGHSLKIVYAGRADEMKGGLDWVRTIAALVEADVPLQATWLGDGPLLAAMQALATELGIQDHINFMGFVGDFPQVLAVLKSHHIFMFCHKTPESPRCLVEALVSGCAIVGYDGPYGRGLVADYGGGAFSPPNDYQALADQVIQLHRDRGQLSALVKAAAQSGQQFDEESVISHRCVLVKTHLQAAMAPSLGIA
jgi:glycosyltransferase involved in cell wall biosynthesis